VIEEGASILKNKNSGAPNIHHSGAIGEEVFIFRKKIVRPSFHQNLLAVPKGNL
jgi:hypothetical protein